MRFTADIDGVPALLAAEAAVRAAAQSADASWNIMVRSQTGLPAASLEMSEIHIALFAARLRPFGFRLVVANRQDREAEFLLDRRAANQRMKHPRRRRGERTPTPIRPKLTW